MNVKEYIGRYEALEQSIKRDERLLAMLENSCGGTLLDRLNGTREGLSPEGIRTVSRLVYGTDRLRSRLNRKIRLYEKYTVKLTLAAEKIKKKALRDYVVNHYLYGFTHEEVAEMNHYCERQIYRQAQEARRELTKALISLNPRTHRLKGRRNHIKYRRRSAA